MAFPTSKFTFAENLGLEVVDVFVGPERKRYVLHKNLLTAQSDYFKKALTGSFMEAEENSIHLKEEDPAAVALLVGWLYLGIIPGTAKIASPFGTSIFSSSQPIEIPVSKQGTVYQFHPAPERSTDGGVVTFQHICHQSHYSIFSPEELRLADYKLHRQFQSDSPALPIITAPFPPMAPASVTALVPPRSQPATYGGAYSSAGNGSSLLAQLALQSITGQTTCSGLFSGSSSIFAQATSLPSAPQVITSQPSASQTLGSGLFPTQPASQPFAFQAMCSFPNYLRSDSAYTRQSAQLNPAQIPNMLAPRFGAVGPTPNSDSSGSTATSQTQRLFSNGTTLSSPQYAYPGATTTPSNHNLILFTGLSYSPSLSSSNGLFGGAAANWTTLSAGFGNPPTYSLFGPLASTASQASNSEGSGTSIFSGVAPSSTGGGVFGTLGGRSLFGSGVTHPHVPQNSLFGSQSHTSDVGPSLPPGGEMMKITPHKPKPGEFGYHPTIKIEKSPNNFLPGIPRADPQQEQFIDLEQHQLALLKLCIMAETFCWPKLFDVAIDAYIRGEHRLQRPMSLDFIDRIYARTHDDSTLRDYALDNLCQMKSEGIEDLTPYMELAHKHSDFLADLLGKVMGSVSQADVTDKTVQHYRYGMGRMEEQL